VTAIVDCQVLELGEIRRDVGSLTPVEGGGDVPFPIERVYYVYDIPSGAVRGGHAHREIEEVIVAALGSFAVLVHDGEEQRRFEMRRANQALYIPRMIWRELIDFSAGAVCVVLASRVYDEADYIRNYAEFRRLKRASGER
jgi:dTDP-4-dehydrorhamnose 3,5-epimerase-like enzyme